MSATDPDPLKDPRWQALVREARLDISAMCAVIRSRDEQQLGQTIDVKL